MIFHTGNGICVDYEKCQCNDNWIGLSCETPTCYDVNNCSLNGLCVSPNKCECFEQFDGENCTEEVAVNLNTPIFLNGSYFALVSENRAKGFFILTVSANDSDQGRSGQISYSIEEASIANFFMISQDSGEITIAADGVLDYESIPQKQFRFTVAATDNGIPTRSSEATVTIAVKDENDNCPVFKTMPGNYKIPVEILANDDDHGDNGQIQYSITEESDPNQKFYITSNGTLLANSVLQPGAYLLTIVAEDGGDIPCARELSVTVVVDEIVLPIPTSISTRASSAMSSTIAPEPSSSLQSSTIALEASSSLQSSTIALEPSSSLQSSTIALKPSSSLQSSTIALEPSSSLQSSTIGLEPSSSLQSSTIALEPSSSLQSSTIALEPSSSLQSSNIALEPSSSLQSSSIALEPSSSLQSSTIALEPSSSLQSSNIALEPSSSLQSSSIALEPSSSLQSSTIALEPSSSLQSSSIALEPSSSLQSSSIALEPYSSLQSSTIALEPSSSLQSSTIALEPSSSLQSSTIALEPSSSLQSSTIALEPSSSLQSSIIALEPSSSLQSSTIALEPSSSLQSSTIALKLSSSLQSSTITPEPSSSLQSSTIAPELSSSPQTIALSYTSLLHQSDTIDMGTTNTALLQPTETGSMGSPISSTQAITINHIVPLRMRLLNIGFVESYRNKTSIDYKTLREMVESTLIKVFEKMEGFLRISDVDFEEGSVIANIKTDFSSEGTQVSTSTLAMAVVDASDENGKLGELHSDTVFLHQQITPTTPPTTESSDDDDDAMIGLAVGIGSAALICLILALCLVSINNYLKLIRNIGGEIQFVLRESASKTQAITRRLSILLISGGN